MAGSLKWIMVVLVTLHGLVHFMGAVKGFGLAEVPQLAGPIGRSGAIGWLAAGLAMLLTGALLAASSAQWVWVGALAAVLSQAMISTAWSEARYGTVVNVVLVIAAAWALVAEGPWSLRAEYRRELASRIGAARPLRVVGEAEVARLPEPIGRYLRAAGALERPLPRHFWAKWRGRIRSGPAEPWMPFEAEQHNFTDEPARLFMMKARRGGLPVDVLHVFARGEASMRARALSLFTVVSGAGGEFTRAETVTLLNDVCLLAPGALLDERFRCVPVDGGSARVTYTLGEWTVSAVVVVNDAGDLVDFVSDDRSASAGDGSQLTPMRWSTPIFSHQWIRGSRTILHGEGRWHGPDGDYAYIELDLLDLIREPPAASAV